MRFAWLRAGVRLVGAALAGASLLGCAELGLDPSLAGVLLGGGGGDTETVAAGLKEALRVGAERSVAQTSRPGGFLNDPRIRIGLPEKLDAAVRGLRALGLGSAADDLETTMNRAAEQAAGEATAIFWQAVSGLTIQDAHGILRGADDAATVYLRGRTEDTLRARFTPVVQSAMSQVGLYRAYDDLVGGFRALEQVASPKVELERYVTDATLAGLFTVLADEEKRIRTDPAARTTALLRQVFGAG